MQSRKQKKQALKIKRIRSVILLIVLIAIIVFTINTIKSKKKNETNSIETSSNIINKDLSLLEGTYIYNNDENDIHAKYTFNKDFSGTLYNNGEEYKFSYEISDQQIMLKFEDKSIYDATYTAYFKGDNLKLIGGTGTVGGEYTLIKEK